MKKTMFAEGDHNVELYAFLSKLKSAVGIISYKVFICIVFVYMIYSY